MADDFRLQYFVVAFLDIMGQKDKLKKLDKLAENEEELKITIQILQDTLGEIRDIRRKFHTYVEKNKTLNLGDASKYPDEIQALEGVEFKTFDRGFGDSFVLGIPLGESGTDTLISLMGVRGVLDAVGRMMLDGFSLGRPLRGGIDMGLGVQLENGELYGPALSRAYTLESQFADYPRIVVGAGLMEFLESCSIIRKETKRDELTQLMARRSLEKMCYDSDNLMILDYLGNAFLPPSKVSNMTKYVQSALQFARAARERFLRNGNVKLTHRYNRLLEYFGPRLERWGVRYLP